MMPSFNQFGGNPNQNQWFNNNNQWNMNQQMGYRNQMNYEWTDQKSAMVASVDVSQSTGEIKESLLDLKEAFNDSES